MKLTAEQGTDLLQAGRSLVLNVFLLEIFFCWGRGKGVEDLTKW